MMNIMLPVLAVVTILFYSQIGIAQDKKKPFTVHDSFSRTKLFDVQPREHPLDGRAFLFSPNGKRVLMISGSGNVNNKSYEFKLLKFELEKIRDVLETPESGCLEPDIVHSIEYDQSAAYFNLWNSSGIKNLRFFKGDDEVIFIAAGDNGKYQLFRADLINKNVKQITNHSNNVVDYVIINDEGDLIYTVESTKIVDRHCSQTSYEIGVFPFWKGVCFASGLSWVDANYAVEPSYDWVDLYRLKIGNNEGPVRLHTSIPLSGRLSEIAIHPSGNKALVIFSLSEAPSELSDKYKSSRYFGDMISRRPDYDPDIMSLPGSYRYFAVISLLGPDILELRDVLAEGESVSHNVQWISSNRIFLSEGEYINSKKADIRAFSYCPESFGDSL